MRSLLFSSVFWPLQDKDILLIQAVGQLQQGLVVPVHPGAVPFHDRRFGAPKAHAVAPLVGRDFEPQRRACALIPAVPAEQGQPQVVFVGSPAEQPPGVPVDAGDLQVELAFGKAFQQLVLHVGPQFLHGLIQVFEIVRLVGFKPGFFIVEPDAPEKLNGLR